MGQLDHILLLAMGPTAYQIPKPDMLPPNSEVWSINTMYRTYPLISRLFIMHDVRTEVMLNDSCLFEELNKQDIKVYTSGDYPGLKNNVVYPIAEIVKEFGVAFFLNSVTYMLAMAVYEQPKYIHFFGIDMRPDSGFEWHQEEKGAVEFWVGVGIGRGIKFSIPRGSCILRREMAGYFYGYVPRHDPSGLVYLTPGCDRRKHDKYKLVPIDKDGNELEDSIIISGNDKVIGRQI